MLSHAPRLIHPSEDTREEALEELEGNIL